jgi:hypothetical protein
MSASREASERDLEHIMSKRTNIIALAAASGLGLASVASASEPSYDELRQQVELLKSRLDSIERTQNERQQATAQTVEQVFQDAERRSQLLQSGGLTAGYDKGFFIGSADGKFSLKPSLAFQFRNVSTFQTGDDDDIQSGFEVRRLRPRVDGNAFSKDLTYSFQFDVSRSSGTTSLLDAWVQYKFADQWALKVGQFKESVFQEKEVSFTRQLAADRSIVDAVLGGNQTDRVQGVELSYGSKDEPLRAAFAFHDGANSKNTDFQDGNANFGFGGRVAYKLSGDWGAYRDFTAKGTKEDLLVIGAGADFTESGDTDVIRSTADVQWENAAGLSAFAAVHANFTEGDDSETDFGAVAQVGYLINPAWEVFGRYSAIFFDEEQANGEDTAHEITGGVNYFFGPDGAYGHNAKLTVDLSYLPSGFPSNQTGLGILASDEDQFVLRAQLTFAI